jgi:NADPH2:quinone reductase
MHLQLFLVHNNEGTLNCENIALILGGTLLGGQSSLATINWMSRNTQSTKTTFDMIEPIENEHVSSNMMKAVRILKQGEKPILQNIDIPKATKSKVLIKNSFCGVNYIDTYHQSGLYQVQTPFTLGCDGAGIVEEIGEECKFLKKGQRVAYYCPSLGAHAEYIQCDERDAVVVPDTVPLDVAAACMVQGMTAHYLAHSTYNVTSADTVLIHACTGGTGSLLVQICKILGARVIGTVGSDEKISIAKSLGVDHMINYNTHDFVEEIKKITNGSGCNVVYDGVGKNTWEGSLKSVARRGLMVTFGNASGKIPDIDPFLLSRYGSLSVCRPVLKDYVVTHEEFAKRASDLFEYVAKGKLKVEIHKVFELDQVNEALAEIQSRNARGKILFRV